MLSSFLETFSCNRPAFFSLHDPQNQQRHMRFRSVFFFFCCTFLLLTNSCYRQASSLFAPEMLFDGSAKDLSAPRALDSRLEALLSERKDATEKQLASTKALKFYIRSRFPNLIEIENGAVPFPKISKETLVHDLDRSPLLSSNRTLLLGAGGQEVFAYDLLSKRFLATRKTGGLHLKDADSNGNYTAFLFQAWKRVGTQILILDRKNEVTAQIETKTDLAFLRIYSGFLFLHWTHVSSHLIGFYDLEADVYLGTIRSSKPLQDPKPTQEIGCDKREFDHCIASPEVFSNLPPELIELRDQASRVSQN